MPIGILPIGSIRSMMSILIVEVVLSSSSAHGSSSSMPVSLLSSSSFSTCRSPSVDGRCGRRGVGTVEGDQTSSSSSSSWRLFAGVRVV